MVAMIEPTEVQAVPGLKDILRLAWTMGAQRAVWNVMKVEEALLASGMGFSACQAARECRMAAERALRE